jgi:hypothetical protein
MKRAILPLAFFFAASALAAVSTTNNDDSCDIAWQPAATLLLPYFEVDFSAPPQFAVQTLFTIQNTTALPQIANVTLWTDLGYPAYSFPVFLTGYDVQPFNLYDLFANSTIVSTLSDVQLPVNPTPGSQPVETNPNFLAGAAAACRNVPGALPPSLVADLRQIFTVGKTATGCQVGTVHVNAIGYITIDVVATCAAKSPASLDYASILLYDNVLTGDYEQLVARGGKSYAQGSPLVHIRAIPEGGPAGALVGTSLPYTFYDRYTIAQPSRTIDRRQPLPSVFAPRYIAGGPGGLNTKLKIWREGVTTASAACTDYAKNSAIRFTEAVRFDEHENATIVSLCCCVTCPPPPPGPPLTVNLSASDTNTLGAFSTSGDVGGWLYLNLSNGGSTSYSAARPGFAPPTVIVRPSQAWVITSMFAEPTYATETTAIALGNGCSPPAGSSTHAQIGPAPNPTP